MIYDFRTIGTEDYFQLEMSMADRETYLTDHPEIEQVIISAPKIMDPLMLGRMNDAGKDFQKHVIHRMQDSIPGNRLGDSKFGRNIGEI